MKGLLEALGLRQSHGANARWHKRQSAAPILMYHRFHPARAETPWTVTTSVFEEQLAWLSRHRRPVPLRRVVDALRGDPELLPPDAVALTVDDGDCTVYSGMFPLIKRYGVPVTLFIFPSVISLSRDKLNWKQLEEMVASGLVDVQFHTLSHLLFPHERKLRSADDYEALGHFELSHQRDEIEQRLGVTVDMVAWPYGEHDAVLRRIAKELGYIAAFATDSSPDEAGLYSIPRINIGDKDRGEKFHLRLPRIHRETELTHRGSHKTDLVR